MHLDWKVWLYVRPPNLKSNISNVLEHHIWNVSKYLKYLGSLIWRCLVKKCFNIKHFKDINFFQSFASIGRVDLVFFDGFPFGGPTLANVPYPVVLYNSRGGRTFHLQNLENKEAEFIVLNNSCFTSSYLEYA